MKYLVSVIVPVYNTEKFLEKCIESIINQTYFYRTEIIIINDGSIDNSLNLIQKYSNKYENIIFVNKKNDGVSVARNIGIKLSRGEWICFVDSDDFIEVNMIEKMYEQSIKNKYDLCICNLKKIDLYENEINEVLYKENKSLSSVEALNEFLNGDIDGYACNKMFKRSLFIKNNIFFPIGKRFEDFSTIFNIIAVSNKIGIINDKLYYYVQHNSNITKCPKSDAWKDIIDNTMEIQKNLEKKSIRNEKFILRQLNLATYYFWLSNSKNEYKSYINYTKNLSYKVNLNFIISNYKEYIKYFLLSSIFGRRIVKLNEKRKEKR